MVFSSILFLFRFLPVFFIVYFTVPARMRNLILFLASLFFYAWGEPIYVILMLFSTVCDYTIGRSIERCRETQKNSQAKRWLILSLFVNLSVLGFFKYGVLFGLNLPLPIGISFYTFQTMSYTIDVYRGEVKAQKSILDFGVFVTLFPQLIAGPIVKYKTALPDLSYREITYTDMGEGIKRFLIGLAKKVLLANNIGLLWNDISQIPINELTVLMAWMGILAYAFQIYFDFSGYSDMAIGLGRMIGFHFPENFNYPYISTSITEFWRRWHISLSSWFRDYVYIPLGGNRKGVKRQIFNLLIVWSLTGLWHGAGWNFLLWGLWFAMFLIIEKLWLLKILKKIPKIIGFFYTAIVVIISWVLFSLESFSHIIDYLAVLLGIKGAGVWNGASLYQFSNYLLLFLLAAICATPCAFRAAQYIYAFFKKKEILKAVFLVFLFMVSVAYIVEASFNPFLYFRF